MSLGEPDGRTRLFLLGRFELHVDGQRVIDKRWPRTKAKALLKLLALQFGATMPRDAVLETLWPGVAPGAAANNLHKNLYYLRAATGTGVDDAIVVVQEGMARLRHDVWIDVHEFVNRCTGARAARSPERMMAALDLYRGELLPDDAYEPWTERQRDNVRNLFIVTSLELSELLEEAGEFKGANERALAALQADPTVEDAHRLLMRQFARSGNPALALRQYEQCAAILRRELDIEPSERTKRAYERIKREAQGLERQDEAPAGATTGHRASPAINFVPTSDGAQVAFWAIGEGPGVPLISMPWLPHSDIEQEWDVPEWRAWHERIATRRTLVRYDPRGIGASRPGDARFTIDATLAELDAVRCRLGLDRFALWASFHSGPAAITYAVRHPERVSHLVLWCSYARGRDLRARDELTSLRRMLTADWRVYSESAAQLFFAWEHQRLARRYAEIMRDSTAPEDAHALVQATLEYDVSGLLGQVRVPTLVLGRKDMPWLGTEFARELASGIPGARLLVLDGRTSVPFLEGAEGLACTIDEFLDEERQRDVPRPA